MSEIKTFTRPQVFAALREIVRALSTAWDLDSTLDLIARKTTEVMQVDSCTIYLLDPDGQFLRLQASTGLARRALGRSILAVGEGMTGYTVLNNEPIFAADAHKNPHFKWVEEANETKFRSLLAVPLVIEDKPIGALNVQTADIHEYSPDEVEILSLIGDLAASTLVRAQLYDRQRRQIEDLRALAQVSETVTSPLYLDDMLDIVSDMVTQIMDAAVCHVYLLDESQAILQKHTGTNLLEEEPVRYGLNEGIVGRVASTGLPNYVANVLDEPDFIEKAWAAAEGVVSLLSVPLSVRDRIIGVLNCYTPVRREFSKEERTLLVTLANQTALAIENSQLITNTAVVREMHHRIKNNLQTIAMLMQLQVYETNQPDTRMALEMNIHRVRTIASVHEVLSEKGFHLVNVKDVLERLFAMTTETMIPAEQTVQIHIHGEALQLPSRAATAIALVVNELAQNAIEHAFVDQENGRVDISLGHSPEEFILLVRDNGRGIPEDYAPNLGLEIAETLVRDDLHGRLKFNHLNQGTEASVRIPRWIEKER